VEFEKYVEPQSKTPVVDGQLEIRLQDRSVLDVAVNLADTPSAEANAREIISTVRLQ
jgi:hypothetical protein